MKEMVLQVIGTAPFPGVPITKDSPWVSIHCIYMLYVTDNSMYMF